MSVHLGWHDDLVVRHIHSLGRAAVWGPAAAALRTRVWETRFFIGVVLKEREANRPGGGF